MAASSTNASPNPAATFLPNVNMSALLGPLVRLFVGVILGPSVVGDPGSNHLGQRGDADQAPAGVVDAHQLRHLGVPARAAATVLVRRDVGPRHPAVAVELWKGQPEL